MSKLSRRTFLGASSLTALSLLLPKERANAQALPTYYLPGAISGSGIVSAGTGLQYNGATVALRSGERAVISRVAQQVAASGVTRAVANKTMSMVATRILAGAAAASPWGIAAIGLGAVAYGAYRYLTADDEAGTNTGASSTNYSVLYDANGAAQIRAAISNGCGALPMNGGSYPNSVVLGAYNGAPTPGGCVPGFRQKVVITCYDTELPALSQAPAGWAKAHTYTRQTLASGKKEYWVFFTKSFPAQTDNNNNTVYEPVTAPTIPDAGNVPDALPDSVKNKTASKQSLADLANGLWKGAVPETDPAVLPWSPPRTVPAKEPVPVPLPFSPPVNPVAPPEAPPVKELTNPVSPLVPPDKQVEFEFPPEIKFPGDPGGPAVNPNPNPEPSPTPVPNPGTNPTPSPTPGTGGNTGIDWGAPPSGTMPGVPEVFSWLPTPWQVPDMPGACTGLPYDFSVVFRGAQGVINPCPVINMARPVVRPVAVLGWTAYAISLFLDL